MIFVLRYKIWKFFCIYFSLFIYFTYTYFIVRCVSFIFSNKKKIDEIQFMTNKH